jgi:CDP-diacylglycerol--glycerol-3-phosphate 3-phosphatidyltransferase
MRSWTRHLPNALTASRGVCGFVVAWLLVEKDMHLAAFFLYIVAMFTDLFDGTIAKRLNAVSETGAWLDPLSDKVLTGTTWIALWSYGWAPTWLALSLLVRDGAVVIGWLIARLRGFKFEANLPGRLMISYEGVALPLLLLHIEWCGVHWMSAGVILGVITLVLAVVSVLDYATQPWRKQA